MKLEAEPFFNAITARGGVIEAKITGPRRISVTVAPENYHSFVEFLVKSGIDHIITASWSDNGKELEIMLHMGRSVVVTTRTVLGLENPELDSLTDVLPAITFLEREINDLVGVRYRNHPGLSRIMLPEDWPKDVFPMRKSFTPKTPEPLRRT